MTLVLPEISDEDIAWVCDAMGLPKAAFSGIDGKDPRQNIIKGMGTFDVEACPGSGKTTLLVAKLAILARHWPSACAGMCVLSHTNAARDEITRKLGASAEASALLGYPHFVGTIHSFVNEFLAVPYLRSIGNPVRRIDTEIAQSMRWARVPRNYVFALSKKGKDKRILTYGQSDYGGGDLSTAGEHTETYKALREVCKSSSEEGYFCYDEMFVWARKLIEERPGVVDDIRTRFPVLFIDEVQDNSEAQSSLLNLIFMKGSNPAKRQRFGDSNQAIYDSVAETSGAKTDIFPGSPKLDIPNSHRFGQVIADIADPLGVVPQKLIGLGPPVADGVEQRHRKPAIFLFDDSSVRSVLPEYAKYLQSNFNPRELARGIFTAVAGVHTAKESTKVPHWIGHYDPSYDPHISRRDALAGSYPQVIMNGRQKAIAQEHSLPLVTAIASGMEEFLRLAGAEIATSKSLSPHQKILEVVGGGNPGMAYRRIVDYLILKRGHFTSQNWDSSLKVVLERIGKKLTGIDLDRESLSFLDWPAQGLEEKTGTTRQATNTFKFPQKDPKVTIRLGSIHSVKGETHWSTLVLESYYRTHHLLKLKPWLLGKRSGGVTKDGPGTLDRLRLHYVAVSRPSHLLCVALRADALEAGDRKILEDNGWKLIDCQPHSS